jgi:hypothetical protein
MSDGDSDMEFLDHERTQVWSGGYLGIDYAIFGVFQTICVKS